MVRYGSGVVQIAESGLWIRVCVGEKPLKTCTSPANTLGPAATFSDAFLACTMVGMMS